MEINKQFYFVNLESSSDDRPFEGLAAGQFVDMFGRDVKYTVDDVRGIGSKTKELLAEKRAEEGEDFAGLPIEGYGHFTDDAVGWITDINLERIDQGVIDIIPRWNDEGREIILSDRRRYFSPTVSRKGVIVGGTLTNWPAIRDSNDLPIMKPVALSDGRYTYGKKPTGVFSKIVEKLDELTALVQPDQSNQDRGERMNIEEIMKNLTADQKAELVTALSLELDDGETRGALSDAVTAALENVDSTVAGIISQRVEAELARESTLAFARKMVGGDAEKGVGLPVELEKFSGFMLSLDEGQREEAQEIFSEITSAGLVDFSERGSEGKNDEGQGRKQLSAPMKAVLRGQIERGISLADFWAANADELGDMSEYDLKEFQTEDDSE